MDQIKIGKFIAKMRKKQGLTQKKLAESLGISDKTVSKWECGKGLPDYAFMLPLCDILGITVNELLSGESLSGEDYNGRAEENIMNLLQKSEETKRNVRIGNIVSVISELLIITFLIAIFRISQNNIIYLIDAPSMLMVLGIMLLELIASKSVKAFFNSFRLIFKNQDAGRGEILASLQAVSLTISSAAIGGALACIIGVISIFVSWDISTIGPNLASAVLSLFESFLIQLLLLPLKHRLKSMDIKETLRSKDLM